MKEAGSSCEHLLQVTIWLADMADFEAMNEVWDAWVPEGHSPARACGEKSWLFRDCWSNSLSALLKPKTGQKL
ncbi:Rid family hydrolase [Pseudomonas sp. W3I7]|uniref:Rid family hydrolase n=1 Tax=Pseudomonas sp. W3I7 TaxID=3042292 RepID=UPI00359444BA